MIKDELHIFKDSIALCQGFTGFLLTDVLADNQEINIALSGGSTPKVLFDYWSEEYADKMPWESFKLFWGDERCVTPDDEMSNYGMTKKHLFDKIDIPFNNIFRIHGENDPEGEAIWYSEVLNDVIRQNNDAPEIDLIILGLGDDGHTASIFPNQINLWDSKNNCVVAKHPDTKMKRVSITGRVINNAKNIAFLVAGQNKAEKVKEIIRERKKFINLYPAARVSPKNQTIHWFLDEDAAGLL